jgi:hypothetical protein
MKTRILLLGLGAALAVLVPPVLRCDEPIIPPTISKVWPAGMQRGTTATFTLDGRNLTGAKAVIFDAAGITARLRAITDVSEKISGPRAGVDLGAQVPLGKKQTAQLEVTVAKDVAPGIHKFRIQTALGTSDTAVLDIGSLPEIQETGKDANAAAQSQPVTLPATLVGAVSTPGDADQYEFAGKAGEQVVFQVVASPLGSQLESLLTLRNAAGEVLAQAGEKDIQADSVLTWTLPQDGDYTFTVTDREKGGGADHFYRINAGALPYIAEVFPLGVRAGQAATVEAKGLNLGVGGIKVDPPQSADGWTTIPLKVKTSQGESINEVKLAVGNEPEIPEQEPNNSVASAQTVTAPVTINGHIGGGTAQDRAPDEDYFRFHAEQDEHLTIEVAAARLGSPLDSVIEVLDAQGNPIPRATLRCLNQTTTTLSDRDSRTEGVRLVSTSGLREGDYLMIGDELDQIAYIPDQPDADVSLKSSDGLRKAFLGTSPDAHAVNTTVYKAQILPPDADYPPNGLPVFHLTWRNDDGGAGYGADSRLDFVAPKGGDYILHLKDVRAMNGPWPGFPYRLTIDRPQPSFNLAASPENPNVPRGGSTPVTVVADRLQGYEGPISVEVKGLPAGLAAAPAEIPAGQDSTMVMVQAAADANLDGPPAAIKFVGHARADGREIERVANQDAALQLATVIPPPDVVVTTEPRQITLEPGKEVTVRLELERHNGFKGRVPCSVQNLPPGVRVVNVGLNGVLVTEDQSARTFTLRAESWAKPIEQPIYVVAEVESNSSTMHPSPALMLTVGGKEEAQK